ncbi:DVU_1556 family methyltransferase [Desulfitobacterium sp. Sab5]|uniref:DVU_1556 family methyltransferase n=1 Tax=Desulfitobacterium nosdiversum TaxID=3375356 RepID=UPI003CF49C26
MDFCSFAPGSRILDVGCGSGASVEFLRSEYQLEAVGVDPSEVLLELGKNRNPQLPLVQGYGEKLPFSGEEMDGVFAECTLSLMNDLRETVREIHRVLKNNGLFVVNDVYARNPEGVSRLRKLSVSSCLRGALLQDELISLLEDVGFRILHWEDHTKLLKQLTGEMIFKYGSMNNFWLKSTACTVNPNEAQLAMREAKTGYFQLIALKS